MKKSDFLGRLIASCPPGLRPDSEFVAEFQKALERYSLSDEIWDRVFRIVEDNFRNFPTKADLAICVKQATDENRMENPNAPVWQTFEMNGLDYAKKVRVSEDGTLQLGDPLPEGAKAKTLVLPYEMQAREPALTYHEAKAMGLIEESISNRVMHDNRPVPHFSKSRFKSIGEIIKDEKPGKQFSEYDDSPEAIGVKEPDWSDL